MSPRRSQTVPGSRAVYRTRSVCVGFVLWVLLSATLYYLFAQWRAPWTLPVAIVLVGWNALLVYLAIRSLWVRLEVAPDELRVHGWFQSRTFPREDLLRIDHIRGPIPLAGAVSLAVRAIPQSWFLVLSTRSERGLALDSTISSYRNSKLQLDFLRSWLSGEAAQSKRPPD